MCPLVARRILRTGSLCQRSLRRPSVVSGSWGTTWAIGLRALAVVVQAAYSGCSAQAARGLADRGLLSSSARTSLLAPRPDLFEAFRGVAFSFAVPPMA